MKEIVDFLNANRVGCLGSVEDGKPRVRPFQFQFEADGKLCFCTASDKPVSAQLKANPWTEFSATSAEYVTVRVRGKAEFRNNMGAKQKIIETNPLVQSIYQTADNPCFEVFFLDHGEAVISDFSGRPPRAVTF